MLSLLLGLCLSAYAQEYEGKVVSISDGDTLILLTPEKRQIKVRLAEIDAPEKSQAFGQRSRQSLSELAFGRQVKVKQQDRDRYGRVVGRVYVGGIDVNAEQIKRGMAWVYRKYTHDQTLFEIEQEARKAKLGLWSDPHAIPPWEYRHAGKHGSPSPKPATVQYRAPTGSSCSGKRYCRQMSSCEEAKFYLNQCGVKSLDRDGDGVPCESLCR